MSPSPLPRYPIYVVSKGRIVPTACLTARFLKRDGVPFWLVVEPQEADAYAAVWGRERLLVLPSGNYETASTPARNFAWEHAKAAGAARHWVLDDNMREVRRLYKGRRIVVNSAYGFRVVEDFTDRYENVAIAGMNYMMFVPDEDPVPYRLNVHVYSCLLIQNGLPHRWRGRYNQDTDLCLQVLAAGWCTVLFNAFMVAKIRTMKMKGGNMDLKLYDGDGRLRMARSLERLWPGVATTKRRFKRPQHVICGNWRRFDTPLKRRTDVDWARLRPNEYGMRLVQQAKIHDKALSRWAAKHSNGGSTGG